VVGHFLGFLVLYVEFIIRALKIRTRGGLDKVVSPKILGGSIPLKERV